MRHKGLAAVAVVVLVLFCLVSCAGKPAPVRTGVAPRAPSEPDALSLLARADPLAGSRQLVLVVTPDWGSITGRMALFERDAPGAPWRRILAPFPVTVGRTGLAFGRGLHGQGPSLPEVPAKREGDGKAPAGAFSLTMGFSYAPKSLGFAPKLPMHHVTADTVCVETPDSRRYNAILDEATAGPPDWVSPDRMLRPDGLYKNGVFVAHNTSPVVPGAGSCIFLHSWRGPDSPTAGCTAMEPGRVVELLRVLDAAKNPVMVQLPRAMVGRLGPDWGLPDMPVDGS